MTENTEQGTPALLVAGEVLLIAAEALAREQAARANLKVRSGEHLAAIFLSGLFGQTPSCFDDHGGPDLVFEGYDVMSWFPFPGPAAFEIKSLPGAWRKEMNLMMRNVGPGQSSEIPYSLRVWSAEAVMRDAHITLKKAEQSLAGKTAPHFSRNVFLITHPWDHFALDVAQSQIVGHLMPKGGGYGALDSVWVFWPPDKLVMWSRATQVWTDILFVTDGEEIPDPDDTLSFIQNVELRYMFAAGITASPYVFNTRFGSP
jgi:hypothetical protein